jgi:hypothetical protein
MSRVLVVDLPSFMQNLMKARCSVLPSITDKMKHKVKKSTRVETMHVHSAVTWETDAIGLLKCDLGFPSNFLSLMQLQQ